MKLSEISYQILNQIRGGKVSVDEHLSIEYINKIIDIYRALLIKREFNDNYSNFDNYTQEINVPFEVKDGNTYKSNTLPSIIYTKGSNGVQQCLINDNVYVEIMPKVKYDFYAKRRFGIRQIGTIYNNILYINNPDVNINVEKITISAIFENPREASEYNNEIIWNDDMEYPINNQLAQQLIEYVVKNDARIISSINTDDALNYKIDTQ